MASLKETQAETMATIDTAKAMIDKVLTIMDIMVNMPSISTSVSTNPMAFILQLLEHAGVTYEDLKLYLTDFLMTVVPAMELGVKAALLSNLKNMVSCSVDPRIPEKYRKQHKSVTNRNTSNEYGIDINVESIDFLDKMSISPLSEYGRDMYFGTDGIDNVYKFARADDFDAFLWFVIHKGKFPMSSLVNANLSNFNDRIHGIGEYNVLTSDWTLTGGDEDKEKNKSLLSPLVLKVNSSSNGSSSILPGNTFTYKNDSSPNIVSMCIEAKRDKDQKIIYNRLVPVSDDLTSVNWYIRRADQLVSNILGNGELASRVTEFKDGKKRTVGVKTKNKEREYSKERAICNLQYLDAAYGGDQNITGLANNKIRFTILPKPYMHIPDLSGGEPPWRFKKLLFDAYGFYDPNGKYTLPTTTVESRKVASSTGVDGKTISGVYYEFSVNGTAVCTLDTKDGAVTVLKDASGVNKTIKYLIECYPGLTVYEFNYDYVMGMKLFDAKVLASTLLQTLVNTRVGISATLDVKHKEATEKIKSTIKTILEEDEGEVDKCFTFDNSKYDALLEETKKKRARKQSFGRVTREAGIFDSVNDLLKEYDIASEPNVKREKLTRAIDEAARIVSEGSAEEDQYNVRYSFVFDLIENLMLAIMNAVLTPKVLMLLEVNQRIMGGTWEEFTVEDVIKAMAGVINAIVKEIRDLLIQELLKLLMKQLQPIVELLGSILVRERLEYYAEVLNNIIKNCPVVWFKFSGQQEEAKLDTVDYADIDTRVTRETEQPKTNKC